MSDVTGEFCALNQPEGVWFLAGTFGGHADRSCEVPAGIPVVFPVVNMTGSVAECDAFMEVASGSAELDGDALDTVTLQAREFEVKIPQGELMRYSCGIWVVIESLSPGEHRLSFEGWSGAFTTSVDYTLTVVEP